MENIRKIGFEFLLARSEQHSAFQYKEDIIIIDMVKFPEEKMDRKGLLQRVEAYCIILVEKGEIQMKIDYILHVVKEHCFFVVTAQHILQIMSISDDFKGNYLIMKPDYLRPLLDGERPPMANNANPLLVTPVIQLDCNEFDILRNNLELLRWNIERNEHHYQAKLVEHELLNIVFETWNFRALKAGTELAEKKSGNRENIAAEFFKLLITHIREEREVAFYANKLCVSPVYLSRAIKHVVGLPAMKIIIDMTISDAKILLRQPAATIQHIAEEMNFPDQASFSKYFKKNTGKSPVEYRRSVNG